MKQVKRISLKGNNGDNTELPISYVGCTNYKDMKLLIQAVTDALKISKAGKKL